MTTFEFHHNPEDCLSCEHSQLRAFCNLTPEALHEYSNLGRFVDLNPGDALFREGDTVRSIIVICSGQVKISTTSHNGKTMILKIAEPGDILGLSASLSNVPHEVLAEANSPCRVKIMPKQEFMAFLGKHGIAAMNAMDSLSADYRSVFKDARRMALSGSAGAQLAQVLLDMGRAVCEDKSELRFTMAMTHEELGALAGGISRETVTRMLNKFRRDGWIIIKGSKITIVEPEKLESLTA